MCTITLSTFFCLRDTTTCLQSLLLSVHEGRKAFVLHPALQLETPLISALPGFVWHLWSITSRCALQTRFHAPSRLQAERICAFLLPFNATAPITQMVNKRSFQPTNRRRVTSSPSLLFSRCFSFLILSGQIISGYSFHQHFISVCFHPVVG